MKVQSSLLPWLNYYSIALFIVSFIIPFSMFQSFSFSLFVSLLLVFQMCVLILRYFCSPPWSRSLSIVVQILCSQLFELFHVFCQSADMINQAGGKFDPEFLCNVNTIGGWQEGLPSVSTSMKDAPCSLGNVFNRPANPMAMCQDRLSLRAAPVLWQDSPTWPGLWQGLGPRCRHRPGRLWVWIVGQSLCAFPVGFLRGRKPEGCSMPRLADVG